LPPQVSQTCDFGPPIFKIAHLAPQVSAPLQNHSRPLILTLSKLTRHIFLFIFFATVDIIKIKMLPALII